MSKKFLSKALLLAVCALLLATAILPCSAAVVTDGESFYTLGDANSDGIVDLRDFVRVKRHLADSNIEIAAAAADLDADGNVSADDITKYSKNLLGLEDALITGGDNWSGIY